MSSHRGNPARTRAEETHAPEWFLIPNEVIHDDCAIIRQQGDLDGARIPGESGPDPFQIGFLERPTGEKCLYTDAGSERGDPRGLRLATYDRKQRQHVEAWVDRLQVDSDLAILGNG